MAGERLNTTFRCLFAGFRQGFVIFGVTRGDYERVPVPLHEAADEQNGGRDVLPLSGKMWTIYQE